jgi:hypothetical protein
MEEVSQQEQLMSKARILVTMTGTIAVAAGIGVGADTLIMRDGRRVRGELIGVRNGLIEFDSERGSWSRERLRLDRADVARIEFDDSSAEASARPLRPSGLRERDVDVDAHVSWNDTGLTVRVGQTLYFTATGRVRWGPGRQDGPAGERGSPRNDARPIPGRPGASLIARIGEADEYFFIGDEQGPIRVRSAGRLYLGVNDDFLQDNTGAFRVTIFY